jgi:hypothetical protein
LCVGMSKPEVESLLGDARFRWPAEHLIDESDRARRERWVYAEKGLFGVNTLSGKLIWFAEDPEALVVYFDANGQVEELRQPFADRSSPTSERDGT